MLGLRCSVLHGVVTFREGTEKSYQLLRDSLDLYLTISPDNVQYLLLQARLYFHLGIWPEKVRMQRLCGSHLNQNELFCEFTTLYSAFRPLL